MPELGSIFDTRYFWRKLAKTILPTQFSTESMMLMLCVNRLIEFIPEYLHFKYTCKTFLLQLMSSCYPTPYTPARLLQDSKQLCHTKTPF